MRLQHVLFHPGVLDLLPDLRHHRGDEGDELVIREGEGRGVQPALDTQVEDSSGQVGTEEAVEGLNTQQGSGVVEDLDD